MFFTTAVHITDGVQRDLVRVITTAYITVSHPTHLMGTCQVVDAASQRCSHKIQQYRYSNQNGHLAACMRQTHLIELGWHT